MVYKSSKTVHKNGFCNAAKPIVSKNLNWMLGVVLNKDL